MRYKLIILMAILFSFVFVSAANADMSYTGFHFDTAGNSNTNPYGIEMNDSFYWITEPLYSEVHKYDTNGTYISKWSTSGSNNLNPHGIVMDLNYLYISDIAQDEVFRYYHNGTYIDSWNTAGSGNNAPCGIEMNSTYFWIIDSSDDEVYCYYHDGTYINSWDTAASGNTDPWGITLLGEYLFITDQTGAKVYKYSIDGTYTGTHFSISASGNSDPFGISSNTTHLIITDDTDNEAYLYLYNFPPTIPSLVSPLNNSYQTTSNITLNVSSTDNESDQITYTFYGGTSPENMIYLGTNDSVDGSSFNWTGLEYNTYYWTCSAGDINETSINMSTAIFFLNIPPNLTSPSNSSTIFTTYPPLTSTVLFTWQDLAAPHYRLMIAEDVNFNVIAIDILVGTNNSNHDLLVNKKYWWKVYTYDGTTYSDLSDAFSFNLTGNSTLSGSAIEGVVYSDIDGTYTALSTVEVTIWNTTWSDTAITGSNGYYVFTGVTDGEVYNVQAKKDLYIDSSVALVNATSDPITQNFYLLPDRTSEEWRHYVKFIVWGPAGYYENVEVKVYENNDVTTLYTADTGADGAVTFIMDRNQEYKVTFINASQGINREMVLYPKDEKYLIFVASTGSWTTYDEPVDEIVGIGISTEIINSTNAYVNVSYNDSMSETTAAIVYLNQSNSSDPHNQTVVDSQDGFTNNWTHSFIVSNYTGESYYIHVVATHTTYGTIDQTYTVQFDDEIGFDGIPEKAWLYISILIMMFTAGMFGASTAQEGAMIVCVEGWMFLFFGWFDSIDSGGIMAAGLGFATVVAIIANINKYSKKEGHE